MDTDEDSDSVILEVINRSFINSEDPKPSIVKKEIVENNPVEEQLKKQLQCIRNQIDQTKNNIEVIDNVKTKILQNLSLQAAYREDISSDSDSDMYTCTGEPILKKKRNKLFEKKKVLDVKLIWQMVVDDKWIIGVVLENTTTCLLKNPTIYMCRTSNFDTSCGITIFWTLINETYWNPTQEIEGNEEIVATVIFDLPSFETEKEIEINGTVFCEFDDKLFQCSVPNVTLSFKDIISGVYALNLEDEHLAKWSILVLKAVSVDRVVVLPREQDSNTGSRLKNFLSKYAFKDILEVHILRTADSLQYFLLEILMVLEEDDFVRILISARSEAQLSAVVQLIREDFPELENVEKLQALDEAAEALRNELQLYLSCNNPAEIQRARIKTDLLIE